MQKPKAGSPPARKEPPAKKKGPVGEVLTDKDDKTGTLIGIASDHIPKHVIEAPKPDGSQPVSNLDATKIGMFDTVDASGMDLGERIIDDEDEVPTNPKIDVSKLRPETGAITLSDDAPSVAAGVAVSRTEEEEIRKMAEADSGLTPDYEKVRKLEEKGYTDIQIIGEGAMGQVYRALDNLNREVVIKTMKAVGKEAHERFKQEAEAAAGIRHPNIVEIYSYDQFPGETDCYIVMEYLHGKTLEKAITEEGIMNCERARDIFGQICSGLAAAHEREIIHRDIKPDNIFITSVDGKDHVKIIDFGVAKIQSKRRTFQTQENAIVGTPEYMSPEQMRANEVLDARTDVYSVGAVMYHAMTGTDPFDTHSHKNNMTFFTAVLNSAPMDPRKRRPDIPRDFETIIMRCLQKDREERFASATELRDALEIARDNSGNIPGPISSERPIKNSTVEGILISPRERLRRKNKKIFWGVTGAVLFGGAATAGTVALMDRGETGQVRREDIGAPLIEEPKAIETKTPDPVETAEPVVEEIKEHEIIFKLNTSGVSVSVGEDTICQLAKSKECKTTVPEGDEKLTFTFKKRGYDEKEVEVDPNSSQTIKVAMKPTRVIRRPVKPRIPKITSED